MAIRVFDCSCPVLAATQFGIATFAAMTQLLKIDCYGSSWLDEVTVKVGDASVWFAWQPDLKVGHQFHLALFQDQFALHRCVFRYPLDRRVAVLTESPIAPYFNTFHNFESRFPLMLTHDRQLLDRSSRYQRLLYGTSFIPDATPPAVKQRNCSFMGSIIHDDIAGYTLRQRVAEALQDRDEVDCYGRGIRPIKSKEPTIVPYRFSVAMENTQHDYNFTEKLIDCFLAETVPIYWGPPSITEFFDHRGILQFNTFDELAEILHRIDGSLYEKMLPHTRTNARRAREMRLSSNVQLHERIAEHVLESAPAESTVGNVRRSRAAAGLRRLIRRVC